MKGGTTWATNVRWILPENARLPRNIQGSFICRKSMTWDKRLYFPPEGRLAEDFFALKKIRRLRPGLNPQTWVPKASTLPLYHRSRNNACSICNTDYWTKWTVPTFLRLPLVIGVPPFQETLFRKAWIFSHTSKRTSNLAVMQFIAQYLCIIFIT